MLRYHGVFAGHSSDRAEVVVAELDDDAPPDQLPLFSLGSGAPLTPPPPSRHPIRSSLDLAAPPRLRHRHHDLPALRGANEGRDRRDRAGLHPCCHGTPAPTARSAASPTAPAARAHLCRGVTVAPHPCVRGAGSQHLASIVDSRFPSRCTGAPRWRAFAGTRRTFTTRSPELLCAESTVRMSCCCQVAPAISSRCSGTHSRTLPALRARRLSCGVGPHEHARWSSVASHGAGRIGSGGPVTWSVRGAALDRLR